MRRPTHTLAAVGMFLACLSPTAASGQGVTPEMIRSATELKLELETWVRFSKQECFTPFGRDLVQRMHQIDADMAAYEQAVTQHADLTVRLAVSLAEQGKVLVERRNDLNDWLWVQSTLRLTASLLSDGVAILSFNPSRVMDRAFLLDVVTVTLSIEDVVATWLKESHEVEPPPWFTDSVNDLMSAAGSARLALEGLQDMPPDLATAREVAGVRPLGLPPSAFRAVNNLLAAYESFKKNQKDGLEKLFIEADADLAALTAPHRGALLAHRDTVLLRGEIAQARALADRVTRDVDRANEDDPELRTANPQRQRSTGEALLHSADLVKTRIQELRSHRAGLLPEPSLVLVDSNTYEKVEDRFVLLPGEQFSVQYAVTSCFTPWGRIYVTEGFDGIDSEQTYPLSDTGKATVQFTASHEVAGANKYARVLQRVVLYGHQFGSSMFMGTVASVPLIVKAPGFTIEGKLRGGAANSELDVGSDR